MFRALPGRKLGIAWLVLCLAIAVHVTDEALTGFLSVYNPSVIAMRERWGWFPMPTFGFRQWLGGLVAAIVVGLLLSPFAFRDASFMRPLAWFLSIVMMLNAGGHILATILGRTVASLRFGTDTNDGEYYNFRLIDALGTSHGMPLRMDKDGCYSEVPHLLYQSECKSSVDF